MAEYFTDLKISPPPATGCSFELDLRVLALKEDNWGFKEAFPFRLPSDGNLLKGIEISNGFVELISSGYYIQEEKFSL